MVIVDTVMVNGKIQVIGMQIIPKDRLPHTNLPPEKYLFADVDIPENFYRLYHLYEVLPGAPGQAPLLITDMPVGMHAL